MSRKFGEPNDAQRGMLLEAAERYLGHRLDEFLSGDDSRPKFPKFVAPGGGDFGPLRDACEVERHTRYLALYTPSEHERETSRAWHDYCCKHGYPSGELYGADEKPGNTYPPRPHRRGDGEWTGLTWEEIRKELRGEAEPRQMDLFAGAVS